MSGEAGASLESDGYSIFIGTGVRKIHQAETDPEGADTARFFAEESAPYRDWLARARPALDALFAEFTAGGIPLVRWSQERPTYVDGRGRLEKGQSLELRVSTASPLPPAQVEMILDRVAEVLMRTGRIEK